MNREIPLTAIMDIPGTGDEVGLPDDEIERCDKHDVLYRTGGACLDCEREDGHVE